MYSAGHNYSRVVRDKRWRIRRRRRRCWPVRRGANVWSAGRWWPTVSVELCAGLVSHLGGHCPSQQQQQQQLLLQSSVYFKTATLRVATSRPTDRAAGFRLFHTGEDDDESRRGVLDLSVTTIETKMILLHSHHCMTYNMLYIRAGYFEKNFIRDIFQVFQLLFFSKCWVLYFKYV